MKKRVATLTVCGLVLLVLVASCLFGKDAVRPAWAFTVNLPSQSPEAPPSAAASQSTTPEATSSAPTSGASAAPAGATGTNPIEASSTSPSPRPAATTSAPKVAASPAASAPAPSSRWPMYTGIGVVVVVALVLGLRYMNRDED